jgi:hypothetical protein
MTELRKKLAQTLLELKEGTITFKAYVEKDTLKKHHYEPKKDKATNWFFGVPRITKEMRDSGLPFVTPETPLDNPISHILIENNTTLDLSQPTQRMILQWLVWCDGAGGLALSREEGKDNPNWDFYIYDEILELNRKSKEFDEKFRAMNTLRETSDANLSNYTRLLGERFNNKTPQYIRMWLQDLLDGKIPGKGHTDFLKIVDDKRKEVKLFAKKLIDQNVVQIDKKTKEIKYGDISLALSEDGLVSWLENVTKDPKGANYDLYITFKEKLS